jgi:hypothetical protein
VFSSGTYIYLPYISTKPLAPIHTETHLVVRAFAAVLQPIVPRGDPTDISLLSGTSIH